VTVLAGPCLPVRLAMVPMACRARCGEIFGVEGDDGAGAGDDRCRDDVFVVGIGEVVGAAVQAFPAGDLGVVEGLSHLLNQVRCAIVGIGGGDSAAGELGRLFVCQFGEDDAAPGRPVHAFGGKGEQNVALQARPEHADVQQRGEHHRIVSACVSASALRDDLPGLSEAGEHGFGVVLVVDRGGRRRQGCVLRCPALLAIGQQVPQLDAAVGPDALIGDVLVTQEFDQRWAADPEQVRGLLGGQHHRLRDDGHRQALPHCFDDLMQHLVDLGRDLDLFTWIGTGQEVAGDGGPVVGPRLVQELQDLRQLFRVHAW